MDPQRERDWQDAGPEGEVVQFDAAPLPVLPHEALVREPVGYWTGEAHRRIGEALRATIGSVGLSQSQWWMLNQVDTADPAMTQRELIARLAPFNEQAEQRDLSEELADLTRRGLVRVAPDGTCFLTEAGGGVLQAARRSMSGAHLAMTTGVTDDAYATAIGVLRQIVANLGSEPPA